MLSVTYDGCHYKPFYAECRYADWRYAECRYAEGRSADPRKKSTERAEKFVAPFAIAILTINQRLSLKSGISLVLKVEGMRRHDTLENDTLHNDTP